MKEYFFFFYYKAVFFSFPFYIQQKVSLDVGLVWAIDEPFLGSNAAHL